MFGESLYQCFSGVRRPSHCAPLPVSASSSSSSPDASPFVFKHFNSLYDPVSDSETLTLTLSSAAPVSSSFSSSGDTPEEDDDYGGSCPSEHDLSTAIASHRLLPASPGRSNSIVESAAVAIVGVGTGVAVPTYSPDPYRDFRRSMEEMVAALGVDAGNHRAHLQELLLCYLALNRKHAHKYIVSAFADLLLALASTSAGEGGRSTT
ncbi:transcription repressor OFP12-like [Canna indica]|uniref:Transcription repressor n=1 Tax=Canna indica TaxID=4628 RepID=A0AAQ3JM62_9LILI|nr:transcription repressor OFP12-like [Canna indica]